MKFTFFVRTPAAYLFVWLAIGIVLANSLTYSWWINIALAIAGLICYFFPSRNSFHAFHSRKGIGIALLLIVIGNILPQQYDQTHTFEHSNRSGIFQMEISNYPHEKARSYQVEVKALHYSADSIHYVSTKGKAIIYLPKTKTAQHLKIGEHILIAGKLDKPRKIGNPDEFDYADYLHHKGINATAYIDSLHWIKDTSLGNTFSLKRIASSLREQLLNIYKTHHIDGEGFAVLSALTLGYTDEIDPDTRNAYSDAGAMHILAVSGLHVGIVYMIIYYLLFWLGGGKTKRIFRSVILIAALWFYAILTGLSPSVCRAAFMFTVFAVGKMFNFNTSTLNTVFFTAFILLLVNPHYLYNISYLLSYSAVISIVTLMPYLQKVVHSRNRLIDSLWSLVSMSVCAQAGTLPLCIYYFYKTSNYFLLSNFIVIPLASVIIYLAVTLFFISSIPLLGNITAWLLQEVLKIQNAGIHFISSLPYSTCHTWIDRTQMILLYLLAGSLFLYLTQRNKNILLLSIGCIAVLLSDRIYQSVEAHKDTELIVYNDFNSTCIDFIDHQKHSLYAADYFACERRRIGFWTRRQLDKPTIVRHSGLLRFKNISLFVFSDSTYHHTKAKTRLSVDYLIINKISRLNIWDVDRLFVPKTIIADGTCSDYKIKQFRDSCKTRNIAFYSVKDSGAFMMKIKQP